MRLPNLLLIALFMWSLRWGLFARAFQVGKVAFCFTERQFALLVLDVAVVTLIGYWLNDWHDREIDRINRPDRFLVQADVRPPVFNMLITTMLFFGAALTLHLAVETDNLRHTWLFPVSVLVLAAYAKWLKRTGIVGNIMVSVMIAALPVLVVLAEWRGLIQLHRLAPEAFDILWRLLAAYAALMFFANLGREVAKDAEDMEGDRPYGVRSLALVFGTRAVRVAVAALMLLVLMVESLLVFGQPASPRVWIFAAVIMFIGMTNLYLCFAARDQRGFSRLSRGHKLLMLAGVVQLFAL